MCAQHTGNNVLTQCGLYWNHVRLHTGVLRRKKHTHFINQHNLAAVTIRDSRDYTQDH